MLGRPGWRAPRTRVPLESRLRWPDGDLHEIFKRNASVPNQKALSFTTSYDDQTELAMRTYQGGEKIATKNELLGEFNFEGIRTGPKGREQRTYVAGLVDAEEQLFGTDVLECARCGGRMKVLAFVNAPRRRLRGHVDRRSHADA